MRKYDVAYVPNGPKSYYPVKELDDMSLEEIVQKYIKTCGKANGNVAICSQCKSPCREGKRAIQLLANKVYNDPPIPLYGGKTLIERAREENLKRRESMKNSNAAALAEALEKAKKEALAKDEIKEEKKQRNYIAWDGWWETSLASGDQVKWVIDNMHLSRTQAKKKIYQYRYVHGLTKENNTEGLLSVHEIKEEVKPVEVSTEIMPDVKIESKLEALMKMQEDLKVEMDKYMKLYEEAKVKYEVIKKKTDTLCSAMDILNE